MRAPRPKALLAAPKAPAPPPSIRDFLHAHYLRQLDWLADPSNHWLIHVFRCRQRERFLPIPGWSCSTATPLVMRDHAYTGPLLPNRYPHYGMSVTGGPIPAQLVPAGWSDGIWDRLMRNPAYHMVINFISVELDRRNNVHLELLLHFRDEMDPRTGCYNASPRIRKTLSPAHHLLKFIPQLSGWCKWSHFCSLRHYSLWILESDPLANVALFEFAVWLGDYLFFPPSQIRQELQCVQFSH